MEKNSKNLNYYDFWENGRQSLKAGKFKEAGDSFFRGIELANSAGPAVKAGLLQDLAEVYQEENRLEEAKEILNKALELQPRSSELWTRSGYCLLSNNEFQPAVGAYSKAIEFDPENAEVHYNYGLALQLAGEHAKSLAAFQAAFELDPLHLKARWRFLLYLPVIYSNQPEVEYYYKRASGGLSQLLLETSLGSPEENKPEENKAALKAAKNNSNFYLGYLGKDITQLQRLYGLLVSRIITANFPPTFSPITTGKELNKKIKIGYISPNFHLHTVSSLFLGWLKYHNKKDFEIFSYYTNQNYFSYTPSGKPLLDLHLQLTQHYSAFYRHMPGDLEGLARQIQEDDLDILVYLDIGMDPFISLLAAQRLAPVQCCAWGHPLTTGLPTIDYFLSSELMEPDNGQDHYSEKLVKLPGISISFKPTSPPDNPQSRDYFNLPEEAVVYLCTNSLFKYLPLHDYVYPEIALKVPSARFVFLKKERIFIDPFRERLKRAFARYNLNSDDYCSFLPPLNYPDFLSLNLVSDLLLDGLSWSGGKTTLDAISCNLPVVTRPGEFMRGRHTFAILKMLEVEETIAGSEKEYLEIAIELGQNKIRRKIISAKIAANRAKLFNDRACVAALEGFYREVVKR